MLFLLLIFGLLVAIFAALRLLLRGVQPTFEPRTRRARAPPSLPMALTGRAPQQLVEADRAQSCGDWTC